MKRSFSLFICLFIFSILSSLISCTKTEDGCAAGYEGSDCKTEIRTKFIGSFVGLQGCKSGNDSIPVTITAVAGDATKVTIANLYNVGFTTNGVVASNGIINIPQQSFGTGTISGSASVEAGKIK